MTDLITRLRAKTDCEKHCRDLYAEAANEIERLRKWLEGEANCPCCDRNDVCVDSCTFAEDYPAGYDMMMDVRKVLGYIT